jgi:hypothetical protein
MDALYSHVLPQKIVFRFRSKWNVVVVDWWNVVEWDSLKWNTVEWNRQSEVDYCGVEQSELDCCVVEQSEVDCCGVE